MSLSRCLYSDFEVNSIESVTLIGRRLPAWSIELAVLVCGDFGITSNEEDDDEGGGGEGDGEEEDESSVDVSCCDAAVCSRLVLSPCVPLVASVKVEFDELLLALQQLLVSGKARAESEPV